MQYDKHGMENVCVLFAKIYTGNNFIKRHIPINTFQGIVVLSINANTHTMLPHHFPPKLFCWNCTKWHFVSLRIKKLHGQGYGYCEMMADHLQYIFCSSCEKEILHPHKTTGKITVLCILIFTFLDSRQTKDYELNEPSPKFNLLLISSFMEFWFRHKYATKYFAYSCYNVINLSPLFSSHN